MFTHGDFRTIFYRQPFRPFRVFLKDGRVVARERPGNMIASEHHGLTVGIPSHRHPDIANGVVRFDYEDVDRVEIDGVEFRPSSAAPSRESDAA
jgi:hypothetical protein